MLLDGLGAKRGALTEFNALLEGDDNTSFSVQVGDLSILGKIKYVITLDADTNLPRDTAKTYWCNGSSFKQASLKQR